MVAAIFELNKVNYSYLPGRTALSNIGLRITPGESVAILGPNGSGKSTLLKLLDGLIAPDSGRFKAFGQEIDAAILERGEFARYFRSQISFVFQDSDIQLFSATVIEDIIFGPLQLGLNSQEALARAEELMDLLGISELKDRSPNQLSGGEKKKVAIAGSLAINPSVLLLDEPTNNLDPKSRVWLYELIDNLSQAGKTILISTQDLELAKLVTLRTVVIDNYHKLAADDATDKIIANQKLLLDANLIHEHVHYHDGKTHAHSHSHFGRHFHPHDKQG